MVNNYFNNNEIMNGTAIPTEGTFNVGDIVVNVGPNASAEPMWICIEAGTPGNWEVVGAGVNNNEGNIATELVCLTNNVIVDDVVNEVEIGISGFNHETDSLTVFKNSVYMIEGMDYNVEGNKIVCINGEQWNVDGEDGCVFSFRVMKTVAKVNPDAVIGMENLKDDVREAIEAAGNIDLSGYATKEEVGGKVAQDAYDVKISELEERVNEAFTSANNGKQLIANAIGEPLNAEDTFSAMSDDINGLLSTFKANMMNNGITVESSDKFKSLIDKIATMVEEGSGKGIQYASGITSNNFSNVQIDGVNFTCLNISLNFKPTILIVRNHGNYGFYIEDFYPDNFNIVTVDNGYDEYRNVRNYEIDKGNNNYSIPIGYAIQKETTYYWAVGVGEEDTTLRDSLASILEEEGVSVSATDDMATLIGKVDQEFDRQVVPAGTAVAANVDSGKTFINSTGQLVTGTSTKITPAGTAVATDVVSGKTFINSTGQLVTGTASKGLETATGTVNVSSTLYTSKSFSVNIPFTPTRLILIIPKVWYNSGVIEHTNVIVTNGTTTSLNAGAGQNGTITISSMTTYSFNIQMSSLQIPSCTITWIAFG